MINNNTGNNDQITMILTIVLSVLMVILMILVIVFLALKAKEKKQKKDIIKDQNNKHINTKSKKKKETKQVSTALDKGSVMDFMEFDKITDNMIVAKKRKKYLMVVECKGVNYDLMSNVEKVGVEEGFQQFLNSLRYPIQIYIQTRTINLESSIQKYKSAMKGIESQYRSKEAEVRNMRESRRYSKEQMNKAIFELTRQRNLLEYGRDVISNTEKMSLNRSVLNKNFYIIIPYYVEQVGSDKYFEEEIMSQAFSELYTRAQALIRTLSSCYVTGKILNSRQLIELLYVAYNRDDSEVLGIDKLMMSGYEDLYSTSIDVFEKKNLILDQEISKRAYEIANGSIQKVKSKIQQEAEKKQKDFEELARKMATVVLETNKGAIGTTMSKRAQEEIAKEGGVANNEEGQKQ